MPFSWHRSAGTVPFSLTSWPRALTVHRPNPNVGGYRMPLRSAAWWDVRIFNASGASGEQAHVPAEQPPQGEDPRLPAAHAHPRWPCRARGASPEGARAPQRLTVFHGAFPSAPGGSPPGAHLSYPGFPDVLPSESRMRHRADFTLAVRRGTRAGRPTMTGHLFTGPAGDPRSESQRHEPAKVGFIVSRAVGTAVVRNRVKRRLRVVARRYLGVLPAGSLLVVRANPPAAAARQADLAADLDLVMNRLLRRQVGALRQS